MSSLSRAVGLYAVLDRDPMDFIDFIKEDDTTPEVLNDLYLMLTMENDKHSKSTKELNSIGADIVRRELERRGLEIPSPPVLPWKHS